MVLRQIGIALFRTMLKNPLGERLLQYGLLVRINRPIGIYLLMWPTLWALWIAAEGIPNWHVLIVFLLGTALMRSAGCAINDYADRHIDQHVQRTANRPIVSGKVSAKEALGVFVVLCLLSFLLVLTLDQFTILLSFGGAALAALYPFMKRHTYLPQVFLGAAFAWAVPMAYAAEVGELTRITWLLYIAAVVWPVAYDTMYAMVDREDDLKIGVKSTAILFGEADVRIIALLLTLFVSILALVGSNLHLGWAYFTGLFVASVLFAFQVYSIRNRERDACFKAFLDNHYAGMCIFLGIVVEYW